MHFLNKLVVATLPAVPKSVIRYFAGRYIAGETLQHAVQCVRDLNTDGFCATLDVLGEDVTSEREAEMSRSQSIEVLHAIEREGLDSNLSIKLTSLGLKLGKDICAHNVRKVLEVAAGYGTFVRFDMEDSSCTSDTIEIFRSLHSEFADTGIALQAYLHRSEQDVSVLGDAQTNFRLCKGIYREPSEVALQGKEEVRQNFSALLRKMFEKNCYVGIATHDTVLVDAAERMVSERGLQKNAYEFQMLLGVRPELRRRLLRAGHKVRLYVPFGEHWYGYSLRRFKENPEIAGYVFKALFKWNA
jgi:proline dehydrogenase